ncbi:unnamed protein product [Cochlearia groenlandica]
MRVSKEDGDSRSLLEVPSKDEVTTRPKSLAKTSPSSTPISIGQVLSKDKGHHHSTKVPSKDEVTTWPSQNKPSSITKIHPSAKLSQLDSNHQNSSFGQVKSSRVQPPKIISRPSQVKSRSITKIHPSAKLSQVESNHQNSSLGQLKSSRVQPPKIISRPSQVKPRSITKIHPSAKSSQAESNHPKSSLGQIKTSRVILYHPRQIQAESIHKNLHHLYSAKHLSRSKAESSQQHNGRSGTAARTWALGHRRSDMGAWASSV